METLEDWGFSLLTLELEDYTIALITRGGGLICQILPILSFGLY